MSLPASAERALASDAQPSLLVPRSGYEARLKCGV
jgi:hypothetical protein